MTLNQELLVGLAVFLSLVILALMKYHQDLEVPDDDFLKYTIGAAAICFGIPLIREANEPSARAKFREFLSVEGALLDDKLREGWLAMRRNNLKVIKYIYDNYPETFLGLAPLNTSKKFKEGTLALETLADENLKEFTTAAQEWIKKVW